MPLHFRSRARAYNPFRAGYHGTHQSVRLFTRNQWNLMFRGRLTRALPEGWGDGGRSIPDFPLLLINHQRGDVPGSIKSPNRKTESTSISEKRGVAGWSGGCPISPPPILADVPPSDRKDHERFRPATRISGSQMQTKGIPVFLQFVRGLMCASVWRRLVRVSHLNSGRRRWERERRCRRGASVCLRGDTGGGCGVGRGILLSGSRRTRPRLGPGYWRWDGVAGLRRMSGIRRAGSGFPLSTPLLCGGRLGTRSLQIGVSTWRGLT